MMGSQSVIQRRAISAATAPIENDNNNMNINHTTTTAAMTSSYNNNDDDDNNKNMNSGTMNGSCSGGNSSNNKTTKLTKTSISLSVRHITTTTTSGCAPIITNNNKKKKQQIGTGGVVFVSVQNLIFMLITFLFFMYVLFIFVGINTIQYNKSNSNNNHNNNDSTKINLRRDLDLSSSSIITTTTTTTTTHKNNNNNNNKKKEEKKGKESMFKMHDLTRPLNHDVQPDVLIVSGSSTGVQKTTTTSSRNLPQTTKEEDTDTSYVGRYTDDTITTTTTGNHNNNPYVLKAFIESIDYHDFMTTKPLLDRQKTTAQSHLLYEIQYPRVNSCKKLIQQFPIDDDDEYIDPTIDPSSTTINNKKENIMNQIQNSITKNPVHYDSYLPWIHDVFPTADGKFVQFIAQNKRRCKSGTKEKHILEQMNPQVALFQHISIKRIQNNTRTQTQTRYQLVDHENADVDGIETRFICRFKPSMIETLSVYNFNYDWTAYRKKYRATALVDNANIKAIHSSQLIFQCPIPESLQQTIRTGQHVINDITNSFVDIIPIRTPPRYGNPTQYLPPWYREHVTKNTSEVFDPIVEFGTNYILPTIENSGRWENIPICQPSLMTYENDPTPIEPTNDMKTIETNVNNRNRTIITKKKHKLVSCIWASAGYTTRGNRFAINDGQRRLLEWIAYNKVIGFDHFYVYDNSGAFDTSHCGNSSNSSNNVTTTTNDEQLSFPSLKPIVDLFDPEDVTYIPWPSKICNNNPNNVDSAGERSSQYAAEQSCRLRFGPHVDWIGQFDIDEFVVPMGKHNTITSLLDELDEEDTKIVSFASWRSWPRWDYINEPVPITDSSVCWHNEPCFDLSIPLNHTMLQAYNCDRQKPGHKTDAMPAEKQIYRSDYVVSHFVHYSVATIQSELNQSMYEQQYTNSTKGNKKLYRWKSRAFPDPRQRFANEETEGLMIHTKAVARQDTAGWERMCHINNTFLPPRKQGLCRLGVPWPTTTTTHEHHSDDNKYINATKDGRAYNCYVNEHVENDLVPKLQIELQKHRNKIMAVGPPAME